MCSLCSSLAVTPRPIASVAPTLPSLPLELVQLILGFAVPPPGYDEWAVRKSVLCMLSLVCRRWRETYQRQLFGDVVLRTVDSAHRFKYAVSAAALGSLVKTIRVGSQWEKQPISFNGDASKYQLGDVFRRCPDLKTLQVGRMENLSEGDLAAAISELLSDLSLMVD